MSSSFSTADSRINTPCAAVWIVRDVQLADGKFRKLESYSVDGLWNQITDAFESLHFWNVRAYR